MKPLKIFLFFFLILGNISLSAQYATTKVRSKHQAYTDSLKQVKYDNILPIWGQKAYKKGFDIPYPTGAMINFVWVRQGLLIDDIALGLKTDNTDIPLTEVDFIEFGNNFSEANTLLFRPDIWVFPFLNIYGIFGLGSSRTEVNLTIPTELQSVVDQRLTTYGFGATAAGGIGPVWVAVDANISWSKPELLDDPVTVKTFGVRAGHNFVQEDKPYRNFGVWIGAMKVTLGSETVGAIQLKDALPAEVFERAQEIEANYFEWLNSLNPNNPIDARKIEIANEVLTPIFERIGAADGDAIVRYSLVKKVKEPWNGVIGAQYQLNKNWMFRAEGGVIGDRKSLLLSVNWRFLL
jgi:hypothetical protein